MATRITPSDEQLRAAWQARRRDTWPATLEAALAMPVLAALVRAEAVRRELAARRAAKAGQAMPPNGRQAPQAPHGLRVSNRGTLPFDRKRAAAGDRDDD